VIHLKISTYKPINHLNMYEFFYSLNVLLQVLPHSLIFHRIVFTVLKIRKWDLVFWLPVQCFFYYPILAVITLPYAPEQRSCNWKLNQTINICITVTWFSISILYLYNGLINFLLISTTKCIPFCFLNQLRDDNEVKPKLRALNTSLTSETSLPSMPPCKLPYGL